LATRSQKAKVGVFLMLCIGVMAAAMALLAGFSDPGTTYTVVFERSILGLYEGGMVEYLGVPIGKVKEITVNKDNKPVIILAIDPRKVTLYKGIEAQLVLYSFASGSMAVSLKGGDPALGELPPGSNIPAKPSLIDDISTQITEVMDDVNGITEVLASGLDGLEEGKLTEMVNKVDGLLDDAKTFMEKTNETVAEANTTITDVRERTAKLIDNVTEISEDAKPVVDNVNELVVTMNQKLKELDVKAAGEDLNKVLTNMAELTEKFNKAMEQFDNIAASTQHEADNLEFSLRGALGDMRQALTAMQMFVDQLAQDPAQLIRGKGKPKESQQ